MNLFKEIRKSIVNKIDELALGENLNFDAITAEPPKDAAHGDVSTNAEMVLQNRWAKTRVNLLQQ